MFTISQMDMYYINYISKKDYYAAMRMSEYNYTNMDESENVGKAAGKKRGHLPALQTRSSVGGT